MCEETELELLKDSYKWATGFTIVKMNRVQKKLGDGCNYGMMYILLGFGLPIHFPLGFYLSFVFDNADMGMGLSFLLWFIIGLSLEFYCSIQRDKCRYNKIIDSRSQMNLFRDYGIKLREK